MKLIKLSNRGFAKVDDGDYEQFNQWRWRASERDGVSYAERKSIQETLLMHRELLGLKHLDGKQCDHINGNGLDNQRSNLRIVTNQQNGFNQKPQVGRSSRFKGVSWNKRQLVWVANIKLNGRKIWLGGFGSEIDAANAYDYAAQKYFGKYARLNLMGG